MTRSIITWTLAAAAAAVLPLFVPHYVLYILNLAAVATIGAVGLNILTGFTGLVAIGHGAFMGVGAYAAAILYTKFGVPFLLALPAAGLVTAAVGVFFGMPSLRLRGFYLAMSTLAAQIVLEYIFKNWESVTNGVTGIFITPPTIFGVTMKGDREYYYLMVTLAAAALLTCRNLFRTDTGRAFIAVRDRDIAAEIVGVNIFKYKLVSFAVSSFYAGVAGAVLGFYMTIINPESYGIHVSINYVAMIIIGGLGTVSGSALGALFVVLIPEAVEYGIAFAGKFIPLEYSFAAIRQILFGVFIIFFLLFEPRGLSAIFGRITDRLRRLPVRKRPPEPSAARAGTG